MVKRSQSEDESEDETQFFDASKPQKPKLPAKKTATVG